MRKRAPTQKGLSPKTQTLRCAVYTRVSTDAGLEPDFNSLDAQREAAEAYVKSQSHEGWNLIGDHYDDGGFSGGSLERPALARLLEAVRSKHVDVIVVYKVDRLTRSLADFAKLVEFFDERGVSFVSVTQSFNTTSSMGRLTLNVLLSFAQFEREVTGERIRDKIAASKKKGIWVGGVVPLGYRVENRKLLIDEEEANTVRMIFERYLALGSLPKLLMELRERGIRTRLRTLSSGSTTGGISLMKGPLAYLLRNRTYLGELNHRGQSYPGEHEAILDQALFDAVQAKLDENLRGYRQRHEASGALLLGRLFDDHGNRMTPTHAIKKGVRYRYYTSCVLAQGQKKTAGSVSRVSATEIESVVVNTIRPLVETNENPNVLPSEVRETSISAAIDSSNIEQVVDRIVLGARKIEIHLIPQAVPAPIPNPMVISWSRQPSRRRRELIAPTTEAKGGNRPIRSESRALLVERIAAGRQWLDEIVSGSVPDSDAVAAREGVSERSIRMTVSLAFLAPDIVKGAIDGRLPRGLGVSRITDPSMEWTQQRRDLGLV